MWQEAQRRAAGGGGARPNRIARAQPRPDAASGCVWKGLHTRPQGDCSEGARMEGKKEERQSGGGSFRDANAAK